MSQPMPRLSGLKAAMQKLADPRRAQVMLRFFKTGKGDYGEGDRFLGLSVPQQRQLAKQYRDLPLAAVESLLDSPVHEHRLTALHILVLQYRQARKTPSRASASTCEALHQAYLAALARDRVNNWDLVDSSAEVLVGEHLFGGHPSAAPTAKGRALLHRLADSPHLWSRRVAMLSTFYAIKHGAPREAMVMAERLRHDTHDLMHKAVGWMLREAGKRDLALLRGFLDAHAATLPRTALRYALEKLEPAERARYMQAAAKAVALSPRHSS